MGVLLTILGGIMVWTGIRGTHKDFGALFVSEFTGAQSFLWTVAALGMIGALGMVKEIRPLSNAFLVLVLIVIFLRNDGFFTQLIAQLKTVTPIAPSSAGGASSSTAPAANPTSATPGAPPAPNPIAADT